MAISEEERLELLKRLDEMANAPDLESLIASGQIIKGPGGYELVTKEAYEAVKDRIKSVTTNTKTGKALFTFYPQRKAALAKLRKRLER
ncbi:hypothetical protein D9M69_507140 [compost metagenome]